MVTNPGANRGPSCLTSVFLRDLVYPTWYSHSHFFFYFCTTATYSTFFFSIMTRWRVGDKSGTSAYIDFLKLKMKRNSKKLRLFETTTAGIRLKYFIYIFTHFMTWSFADLPTMHYNIYSIRKKNRARRKKRCVTRIILTFFLNNILPSFQKWCTQDT